jgi:Ca-activated chloride channel family protein
MKIAAYISGAIAVLLLTLLFTGWADADDGIKKALRLGNEQYASAAYEEALKSYETGLQASPENKTLNFNAAQAAYMLGDYEKAAQYYEKAADSTDKYLNAGNIFFGAGEAAQDANQKMQFYVLALQIYQEGIIKYPQNVPLKYNYETVKKIIEELLEEMEQEGEDSQSDEQNEGEDSEESEANREESEENQEQESEDAQNAFGDQDEESDQEESSSELEDDEQEGEAGEQDANAQDEDEDEYNLDQEAIARILEMLEMQETESLKNNQEVIKGKDGKIGW